MVSSVIKGFNPTIVSPGLPQRVGSDHTRLDQQGLQPLVLSDCCLLRGHTLLYSGMVSYYGIRLAMPSFGGNFFRAKIQGTQLTPAYKV